MIASLGPLALVFLLLAAVLWWLRRLDSARRGNGLVQVLETAPVAPGKEVCLVRAGRRRFLLATTNHAVSLISELEAEEAPVPLQTSSTGSPGLRLLESRPQSRDSVARGRL